MEGRGAIPYHRKGREETPRRQVSNAQNDVDSGSKLSLLCLSLPGTNQLNDNISFSSAGPDSRLFLECLHSDDVLPRSFIDYIYLLFYFLCLGDMHQPVGNDFLPSHARW